jgi:hypothetical protein
LAFPGRIDLYLTAPTDYFLGARSEGWLKLLLTHELTHFVHQSLDTGLLHGLSLLFGRELDAYGMDYLPGWAVEGPAVYAETAFTEGGRGRNPLFEMYTRAPAEDGGLFSLGQAAYLSPFPPPSRIYVAGYAIVDWLETAYGPGTFRRIMEQYLEFPFLGPGAAISIVTGKDPTVVFAELRKAMTVRAAAFSAVNAGTLVTPESVGYWSRPQPTARGLYLYRTAPDAFPAIVRWDAASHVETVLAKASLTDASSFSATADGATVWFSSLAIDDRRPAEERSSADLFRLDVPAGRVTQVSRDAHLWHPAVSADGTLLLAVQGVGPYSRLVAVDPRTGGVRTLFSRAGANVYNPALAPDGATVAFILNIRGMQDVCVADLGKLEARSAAVEDPRSPVVDVNPDLAKPVIGPDRDGEYFPSFADNATLLFSSDRTGSMSLYEADLAAGTVTLAQRDPVAVISAAADGGTLYYGSYSSLGYCIRSVPVASLERQPLPSVAEPLPYPEQPQPATPAASRRYLDLPLPYLWLPRMILTQAGSNTLDLAVGLGAQVFGGSLLGASQWSADAAWQIGLNQPDAGFSSTTWLGPVGIALSSRLGYSWVGVWEQVVDASAQLAWKILDGTRVDASQALVVDAGLYAVAALDSSSPFTVAQALGAADSLWVKYIGVPLGIAFSWQKRGGSLDFNPPLAVSADLSGIIYLPVLTLDAPQGEADFRAFVNVPGGGHDVVKLGIKAAQSFGGPFGTYYDVLTIPRGFSGPRQRTAPGGLLAAVDYLAPLGLLDAPLIFGWGLTGIGIGSHVEALADFDATGGTFTILPEIFVGFDVTLRMSFGNAYVPVGIGVAVALRAGAVFEPARDLGVYFFTSFDSFTGATAKPWIAGATAKPWITGAARTAGVHQRS